MVEVVNRFCEFLILYSSFIPCMDPADGNFQEADTLVELKGERLKLLGDLFGPIVKNTAFGINHLDYRMS